MGAQFDRKSDFASLSVQAVEEIHAAKTSYDIFKTFKTYLPAFRLRYFVVFVERSDGATDFDDRVVLTNWESEVIHRSLEADFYHWELTAGFRNSVLSHSVALSEYLAGNPEPSHEELAEFLLANGYDALCHFPARSSNGWRGAVSFAGLREKIAMDEMMNLQFVAKNAFERLMHLLSETGVRENPLSPREVECLKATARGFNAQEVADQVGITTHTVNYHLANAQKKLDARNKTQAVAIAIRNGWLGGF